MTETSTRLNAPLRLQIIESGGLALGALVIAILSNLILVPKLTPASLLGKSAGWIALLTPLTFSWAWLIARSEQKRTHCGVKESVRRVGLVFVPAYGCLAIPIQYILRDMFEIPNSGRAIANAICIALLTFCVLTGVRRTRGIYGRLENFLSVLSAPSRWSYPLREKNTTMAPPGPTLAGIIGASLLVCFLVLGFAIRWTLIPRGLPYHYNWDEFQSVSRAIVMFRNHTLNPHFFNYPSLNIYLQWINLQIAYFIMRLQGAIHSPDELLVYSDTGFIWTMSHPLVFYIGRLTNTLLSTFSILIVFKTGRLLDRTWAGLVAAGWLALNTFHAEHTNWTTVDFIATFVLTLWAYALARFARSPSRRWLDLTALLTGLAISSKYNLAILLFPTLFLLNWEKQEARWPQARRIIALTIAGVLLGTPFALLDFREFVSGMVFEFRHYALLGHGPNPKILSWGQRFTENFLSLNEIVKQCGPPGLLWLIPGSCLILLWRSRGRSALGVMLLFSILFFVFMASMKVFFNRNLTPQIPILALFIGVLSSQLARLAGAKHRILQTVLATSILLVMFTGPSREAIKKIQISTSVLGQDSRSRLADQIHAQLGRKPANETPIALLKELRLHSLDAAKLGGQTEICSLSQINRQKINDHHFRYLYTARLSNLRPDLQQLNDKIISQCRIAWSFGEQELPIDRFAINPAVALVDLAECAPGTFP